MTGMFNDEFDKMIKNLIKSLQRMENGYPEKTEETSDPAGVGDKSDYKQDQPFFYGYSITTDQDGNPVVKEFGNISPPEELRPSVKKGNYYTHDSASDATKEPIVDSFYDKKHGQVRLVAEMPGVTKEDISISVTDDNSHVHLSAQGANKKYDTKVPLEKKVKDGSVHNLSYSNGILEVSFEVLDKKENQN